MSKSSRSPKSTPRVTETDRERAYSLSIQRLEIFRELARPAMYCLTVVALAYIVVYLPIKVSAGTTTAIRYLLDFAMNIDAHVWLAWGSSAAMAGLYWRERNLRLRERAEKDGRITLLESAIDSSRTSSGLSVSGTKETSGETGR